MQLADKKAKTQCRVAAEPINIKSFLLCMILITQYLNLLAQ